MRNDLDAIGLVLLAVLAAVLIGGGVALVASGLVKGWELLAVLGFGGVLVAGAHPRATPTGPHNAMVHGAARTADESEAVNAARGNLNRRKLDDHHFKE
jgi:hypothetical protein